MIPPWAPDAVCGITVFLFLPSWVPALSWTVIVLLCIHHHLLLEMGIFTLHYGMLEVCEFYWIKYHFNDFLCLRNNFGPLKRVKNLNFFFVGDVLNAACIMIWNWNLDTGWKIGYLNFVVCLVIFIITMYIDCVCNVTFLSWIHCTSQLWGKIYFS